MNKAEVLQKLKERWQVYAGEYRYVKEFNPIIELAITVAGKPLELGDMGDVSEEEAYLILEIDELLQTYYNLLFHAKDEFLIHKECFHPTYGQWCVCSYTTATEYVYLLDKVIQKHDIQTST